MQQDPKGGTAEFSDDDGLDNKGVIAQICRPQGK